MFPLVRELADDPDTDVDVAVACRVLNVSTSGYYDWRDRPPAARTLADAALTETVREIHASSYGTYGARRVHAELRLGQGVRCGRKRVERLMRRAQVQGAMRADATTDDISVLMCGLGSVVRTIPAPDMWRRYVALMLDGLRAS